MIKHTMMTNALLLSVLSGTTIAQSANEPQSAPQSAPESAAASENEIPREINEHESSHGFSFRAWVEGSANNTTDFDDDSGDIQFSELTVGLNATKIFDRSKALSISFESGWASYDITQSSGSGMTTREVVEIGQEIDDLYSASLTLTYMDQFNAEESWFIGGNITASGESSADFGDSIYGWIAGGYSKAINEKLTLGIGVLVRTRLDDDVSVVPIPQFKYIIDDRWSIENERLGVKLNYKASDVLTYGIVGNYETDVYRLDDSHGAESESTMTHQRIPVALFAEYAPKKNIALKAKLGAQFGSEIEFIDTDGNEISSEDIETSIFGSLNVSFSF